MWSFPRCGGLIETQVTCIEGFYLWTTTHKHYDVKISTTLTKQQQFIFTSVVFFLKEDRSTVPLILLKCLFELQKKLVEKLYKMSSMSVFQHTNKSYLFAKIRKLRKKHWCRQNINAFLFTMKHDWKTDSMSLTVSFPASATRALNKLLVARNDAPDLKLTKHCRQIASDSHYFLFWGWTTQINNIHFFIRNGNIEIFRYLVQKLESKSTCSTHACADQKLNGFPHSTS